MKRSGASALITAAALCAGVPSAAEAATFLSVGASSLCGADGCFVGGKKTYTQTFSGAGRAGVLDVSQLLVAKSIVGSVEHTAVKISFVLADGTEVTWGKYSLNALGGDVVTLGGQALAWNTAAGDLTVRLDLVLPEKGGVGGGGGFGGGFGGGGGDGGGASFGAGPLGLGGFELGRPMARLPVPDGAFDITAVPEPGAWAMMILGFGMSGVLFRRQNRHRHLKYG